MLFPGPLKPAVYLSILVLFISANEGVAFFGFGGSHKTKGSKSGIDYSEPFFVPDDLQLSEDQRKGSKALAHFAYARFLQLEAGEWSEQAQKHYMQAVEYSPYSENLVTYTCGRLLLRNKYDEVIQFLLPLVEKYPDSVPILQMLVDSYRATDRDNMAIKLLEKAFFKQGVRKASIVRQLTALYWRKKQFDSIDELLEIARTTPELNDSFAIYYALAVYHAALSESNSGSNLSDKERKKHAEQAGKYGGQAVSFLEQVENKRQIATLTEVLVGTEHFEAAIKVLNSAIKKFGDDYPGLLLQKADVLRRNNNKDAAFKMLERLELGQQENPGVLLQAGKIYARLGKYENAMNAFNKLLKKAPTANELRRTMAFIMLRQGKPEQAVSLLQEADSLNLDGKYLLSRALYQVEEKQEALRTLKAALKQARQNDKKKFITNDVKLYQATLNEACGNVEKALAIAEKVYNAEPYNARNANFYGYLLADHNQQLEKAQKLIEKALTIAGNEAAYLDSLAWVHFRRQHYEKALELIISALRRMKHLNDPVIYEHAGDIYAAAEFPLTAASYWLKALSQGTKEPRIIKKKIKEARGKSMSNEYKVPPYSVKAGASAE